MPPVEVHATRSSGICSVIRASNSRLLPPMSTFQWVIVSDICRTSSTPSMNSGNSSNWVHWSYAVRIGTATSTDLVTLLICLLLRVPRPVLGRSGRVGPHQR